MQPILVIEDDAQLRRLGAFAYLQKPFDLDDLVDHIRRGLGHSSVKPPTAC